MAFSIGIMFLAWEGLALMVNKPALVPGVPDLVVTLGSLILSANFYLSVLATLGRGIAGLILSGVLAMCTALLFARNENVYGLFKPLLTLMRSVPVISFILLALLYLQPKFPSGWCNGELRNNRGAALSSTGVIILNQ